MREDALKPRQLLALSVLGLLSALVRRYPLGLVRMAGRSAWLAALFALPPLCLWLLALASLLRRGGGGLGEGLDAALGPRLGSWLRRLYGLWALAYAGFTLRAGALRLVAALYPAASPALFALTMAVLCAPAALGPLRALGRCALALRSAILGVIALVLLLALRDADPGLLLPLRRETLPSAAEAGLALAGTLSSAGLFALLPWEKEHRPRLSAALGWGCLLTLLTGLVTAVCLSVFGSGLGREMRYPFFLLARDVSVLGALERAEPLVAAMWLFTDYCLVSALLWMAPRLLLGPAASGSPRLPALAVTVAAAALALLLPADQTRWDWISEALVPRLSAGMTVAIPVLAECVGRLRRGKR